MERELKDKWTKALRSGDYKQGKFHLKTKGNEYCCLGVLCDIVDPEGWQDFCCIFYHRLEINEDNNGYPGLGRKASRKLKVSFEEMKDLAYMNDNGHSFETIAKWIEQNVEETP